MTNCYEGRARSGGHPQGVVNEAAARQMLRAQIEAVLRSGAVAERVHQRLQSDRGISHHRPGDPSPWAFGGDPAD